MAVNSAVEMEQPILWIAVAMAMMMMPYKCWATTYNVGGPNVLWTYNINYNKWAASQKFYVGDKIVFNYTQGTHDVVQVNQADYKSCVTTNSVHTYSNGDTAVTLNTTGARYYICGLPGHCALGMNVTLTVLAAPSSGPTSSTPNTGSGAPSPTAGGTEKSTAAPSYISSMNGVVLALPSLVLAIAIAMVAQ